MKLYPWHEAIWTRLWATGRERLPHALLLCGHSGVGKRDFALRCAQALLCGSPDGQHNPCGHCSSCNSFQQSAHPDFRLLVPSAESALDDDAAGDVNSGKGKKLSEAITVDQVRGLADFVSLTSHQSGQRVVLIAPAEQLNSNAANALLKMLEEPPAQVTFLLVTNQLARILPTIRSRCRLLRMPIPDHAQASQWLVSQGCKNVDGNLALAGGAPLDALARAENDNGLNELWPAAREMDPLQLAERVQAFSSVEVMDSLQTWLYDLLSVKLGLTSRYHVAANDIQQRIMRRANLLELIDLQRAVLDASRLVRHPLNPKLFWESIFIRYVAAIS